MTGREAILVSIDPGKSGAFALFDKDGYLYGTHKVKVATGQRFFTDRDLEQLIDYLLTIANEEEGGVVMEGLLDRHMPKQSAVATNTTAVNWGIQYGLCSQWVDEVQVVRPVTWKTKMGLSGQDKQASVDLALTLVDEEFLLKPRMRKPNVDIAEAVLIGIYYGRKELGWTI